MDYNIKVKVLKCPSCGREMLDRHWRNVGNCRYLAEDFHALVMKHELLFSSDVSDISGYHEICELCKSQGKAVFKCALCGEIKPSNKSKEYFGDPPEHLCVDCFNSKTAFEWCRKVDELEDEHRYDFE